MLYEIFCDESRPTCDRYMVLGGIIVPRFSVGAINGDFETLRDLTRVHREIKWTKISNNDEWINKYKLFLNYFFDLNHRNRIRFHSLIVDRHKVDYKKYCDGDKELGFYKFYYQLLLHKFGCKYVKDNNRFIVYPDRKQTSYPVPELRDVLNNGLAKVTGNRSRPFVSVEPQDSHDHNLLQMTDLLIGAIGYQKNGWHLLDNASAGKIEIARYVAQKAVIQDLGRDTLYFKQKFTVWNFRLSP
jgi:hypothetical protein